MTARLLATTVLVAVALAPGVASATSFDCDMASTPIEHMLCTSPELSHLDDKLAAFYKQARNTAPSTDGKALIVQKQRDWVRHRNALCHDEQCLKVFYRQRISDLSVSSSVPAVSEQAIPNQVAQVSPTTPTTTSATPVLSKLPAEQTLAQPVDPQNAANAQKMGLLPCTDMREGISAFGSLGDLSPGRTDIFGLKYRERTRLVFDAFARRARECLTGDIPPDLLARLLKNLALSEDKAMQTRADAMDQLMASFKIMALESKAAQSDLPADQRRDLKPPFELLQDGSLAPNVQPDEALNPQWQAWGDALEALQHEHDDIVAERRQRDETEQTRQKELQDKEENARRAEDAASSTLAQDKLTTTYKADLQKAEQSLDAAGCGSPLLDSMMFLSGDGTPFVSPRLYMAVVALANPAAQFKCFNALSGKARGFSVKVPGQETANFAFRREGSELYLAGAGRGDEVDELSDAGKNAVGGELQANTSALVARATQNVARNHGLSMPTQ